MEEDIVEKLSAMGCSIENTLNETFMGNKAFYLKMFRKLAANTALARMRAAFDAGDASSFFAASHELKGVYASLGLTPLYEPCSGMVEVARAGSLDGIAETLSGLEGLHARYVALAQEA